MELSRLNLRCVHHHTLRSQFYDIYYDDVRVGSWNRLGYYKDQSANSVNDPSVTAVGDDPEILAILQSYVADVKAKERIEQDERNTELDNKKEQERVDARRALGLE